MAIGDQPVGVMVLAGLLIISMIFPIFAIINFTEEKGAMEMMVNADFHALFYLIFLVMFIPLLPALAVGLWLLKSWARTGTIIFAILAAIMFILNFNSIGGIGAIMGILTSAIFVWYLRKEEVGEAFTRF
jgi:hypothetical protein